MSRALGAVLLVLAASAAALAQAAHKPGAEEGDVKAVAASFVDSWNRHDMKAFAELFAEDADFVNVIGMWWHGRAEIQKQHEAIHAARMKASHLAATRTEVSFLRPDVAVMHVRWELTGEAGPDGKPLGPRTGIVTFVVARTAGKWSIVAGQNTNVVPPPSAPATQ